MITDVNLGYDSLLAESDQAASPMEKIVDPFLQPALPV